MNRTNLPISLIVTCFNEEKNVADWCKSLLEMEDWPSEIIISDSESTDNTVNELRKHLEGNGFDIVILPGKCTISEGRNRAIARARFERVAITDFGVIFDRRWLTTLNQTLANNDWAGGCYTMEWQTSVQRAFCRLFDVDAANLDEERFMPSSRSFALTKSTFQASGGYDTTLVLGEDTALVLRLRSMPLRYKLERQAVVHWLPRRDIRSVYLQNYRYAYWDGRAYQNNGRWLHVLFWAVITLTPVIALASQSWGYRLGMLSGAMVLLFAKASRNTLRGTSHSWARPMDLFVYYVTNTGSVAGYISGTLRRWLINRK